jgi:hypothetical protein
MIVGDSKTGYSSTYHGFYTPLRLVYSLLQSVPWDTILQRDWLGQLQLDGDEGQRARRRHESVLDSPRSCVICARGAIH